MPDALTILRAAAAVNDQFWCVPTAPSTAAEPTTADPLTALTLRTAAHLLGDLPKGSLAEVGLILGTTLGSLETDRLFDRSRREADARYASPAAFARTLPSTTAAQIALTFHLTGPSLTLCAGGASAAIALRRAAAWMHQLQLPLCLAGGFDWITSPTPEPGAPETLATAMFLLAPAPPTGPFPGIGTLHLDAPTPPDLTGRQDTSLEQLIRWTQHRGDASLHTGIRLLSCDPRASF